MQANQSAVRRLYMHIYNDRNTTYVHSLYIHTPDFVPLECGISNGVRRAWYSIAAPPLVDDDGCVTINKLADRSISIKTPAGRRG
jgi:hypothetical protein